MSAIVSTDLYGLLKHWLFDPLLKDEICSSIIKDELQKDKPSMIARFGSVEIKAILYPKIPTGFRSPIKNKIFETMEMNAGFFPANEENIRKFSELMIEDMKQLDILGSWRIEERFLRKYFPTAIRIQLRTLEPYLMKDPWTEVLQNKKVLVIHPFNTTIENQYRNNRQLLFDDKRILPEFQTFETIKAIQTIAGNRENFTDWFAALDFMKREIDKKDFDIAIIGCGAYGFPLAAHVKRMGKKAVHLGGATQILFGIKGKRWIDREKFKNIINNHFVQPSDMEKPNNSNKVESGCYW